MFLEINLGDEFCFVEKCFKNLSDRFIPKTEKFILLIFIKKTHWKSSHKFFILWKFKNWKFKWNIVHLEF